jgi:hypothetical protein
MTAGTVLKLCQTRNTEYIYQVIIVFVHQVIIVFIHGLIIKCNTRSVNHNVNVDSYPLTVHNVRL